jgi:hypothetical protein
MRPIIDGTCAAAKKNAKEKRRGAASFPSVCWSFRAALLPLGGWPALDAARNIGRRQERRMAGFAETDKILQK